MNNRFTNREAEAVSRLQSNEEKVQWYDRKLKRIIALVNDSRDQFVRLFSQDFELFEGVIRDMAGADALEVVFFPVEKALFSARSNDIERRSEIDDALEIVHECYLAWQKRNEEVASGTDSSTFSNCLVVELDRGSSFLPSENLPLRERNIKWRDWEKKFRPKLNAVIDVLTGKDIRKSDIVIVKGAIGEHCDFQNCYTLIEIPYLRKQVLVSHGMSDEIIVIHEPIHRNTLGKISRDELRAELGENVEIIDCSDDFWKSKLRHSIKQSYDSESGRKISVQSREAVIAFVKEVVPDKWHFANMTSTDSRWFYKRMMEVTNVGGVKIGKLLGIQDTPDGKKFNAMLNRNHHKLVGQAIYGKHKLFEYRARGIK